VLVNAITLTVTETELMHAVTPEMNAAFLSRIPKARSCKPEEVAAMIAFLLGDDLSCTTGSVFDLSGGRTTYWSQGLVSVLPKNTSASANDAVLFRSALP
jgi:2-dehydro-3-deoxy-L-rhamnonate dehydrogenase (NAD+)